ncbi:MAG: fumarylacetoacetate hydrolase family protein [Gemmataceae bacterium]
MRFATIQAANGPRAVVQKGDDFIDLNATDAAIPNCVKTILEGGPDLLTTIGEVVDQSNAVKLPVAGTKYLPPILNPQKIMCIGLNYKDHAAEQGIEPPSEPILFSKYPTALVGHEAAIHLPAVSHEVDFEAELVLVIGKSGRHIKANEAMEYVGGFMNGHDVSARDWQLRKPGKQWMSGKTFDTFGPTGPILVTSDEVGDPHNLAIQLRLNGETMQDSNTSQLIFGVGPTLEYISQIVTLHPGDLIFTGTPPGVGVFRNPPVFLKGGDVVEIEIEKLGVLRNPVVQD